jgi:hypothetical protein
METVRVCNECFPPWSESPSDQYIYISFDVEGRRRSSYAYVS